MNIVDASVATLWFVDEPFAERARALLTTGRRLAPDLIVPEVANALWKIARTGAVSPEQAEQALRDLPDAVETTSTVALAPRAFAIARALKHPAYDCFYLALSEALQAPFVTLDHKLFNRTRGTPWAALTTLLGGEPALT